MSSTRRAATETNILAMLDRHESGARMRRLRRGLGRLPSMLWYGIAAVAVVGLVGSLAWLARGSGSPSAVDGALAGAVEARARPATELAAPAPASAPATASARASAAARAEMVDEAQAAGATIVDLAPAAEAAPPLQELRVPPPQQHAGRIAQHEDQREPQAERQRQSVHAAAPRSAPHGATGKAPSSPRSAALAHAEPRARRSATPAKTAPAAVDTDVALISAIIQHANKRQEAEEAAGKQ